MVELRFRIRNSVFNVQEVPSRRATIRPLSLCLPSVEEAALLGEVDESANGRCQLIGFALVRRQSGGLDGVENFLRDTVAPGGGDQ